MTKGDKILIVFVIIVSITLLIYLQNTSFGDAEKYISVQVNGVEIKKIIFDKKIIGNTYPVQTEFGYNLIEVGDEKVRVIEADCPDKLDVKQGYISRPGQVIVCLPNRLVIEIIGSSDADELDHITY